MNLIEANANNGGIKRINEFSFKMKNVYILVMSNMFMK